MEVNTNFQADMWNLNNDLLCQATIAERLSTMSAHVSFELSKQTLISFTALIDLVKMTLAPYGAVTNQAFSPRVALVSHANAFLVLTDQERSHQNPWVEVERDLLVQGYGPSDILASVYSGLSATLKGHDRPALSWTYSMGGHRQQTAIVPAPAKPIHDAFYPWLGDVHAYQDQFLKSNSNVLVLLGEPGTAKTSFIRSFMWRHCLSTMFTYDEKLLESDEMFVALISGEADLLVVEDADLFLTDREHAGNRMMARFLNVSDGLAAGVRRKKIIFTANIMEQSKVDTALLRPGRCFDCSVFRRLSFSEALRAAEVAGLPTPVENKAYTLAELFALGTNDPTPLSPKKIGY